MIIKVADTQEEWEQIFRLNHQTFAEEIPQHAVREDRRLVDVFHDKNTYVVAKEGEMVIGMVCYNSQRPFSLDKKQVNLEAFLPLGKKLVEVRLLAVNQTKRNGGIVAVRLLQGLIRHLIAQGVDLAVISGVTSQLPLYRKIGFTPFGPLVGKEGAWFQPMVLPLTNINSRFTHV